MSVCSMFIFKYCFIVIEKWDFMYIINMTYNVIMFYCNLVVTSFSQTDTIFTKKFLYNRS